MVSDFISILTAWGGLFVGNLNDVRGWSYEINPLIYEYFYRENQMCTNNMLENGLMYLY